MIAAIIAQIFISLGFIFALLGHLGVIVFPDVYTRLQASSTCATTSVISFFIAAMVDSGFSVITGKIVVISAFFIVSSPVSAHIVARYAWSRGIMPWRRRRQ
ncbi:MAG: monovalent cation/H(+) antiporter subunit G [Spirochaetales bacterium]|nr:monovalent cation/H(+) antiporter subunit G [Spirochaetales bacterium]